MNLPYSIEIVPADRGWILEKMAKVIEREAMNSPQRFNVRVVDQASDRAELTFFLPASAYRQLEHSTTVTYLAHKEEHAGAAALFEEVARKSDYCITSSSKYQRIIEQDGAKKVFKIPLGVDTELFVPKLRLGVVGRTYHTGRKGEALLATLAGLPMVELRFTGSGWPYPSGNYDAEGLARFYREIDYLLIPSLIEGGPVPLLEALSSGCPVIAPTDIGFVEDFPHIPFKRGDAEDLRRVVEGGLAQKMALRESVLECDWSDFANRHLDIFAELIEHRRKTKPSIQEAFVSPSVENAVRVLLVTHGIEDTTKGGPSTRIRFIEARLKQAGHHVEACHNIQSADMLADFDVVHVFNYWPPQTAMRSMALAKKAGKRVVLSPIALDLGEWPVYRQLLECVFSTGDREKIEAVLKQLPDLASAKRYSGQNPDPPVEGIPGHFEALRQCCALADHLIFLSEFERAFLSAFGAETRHGTLIHNGVSDAFDGGADPDLFRKKFGLDDYVLCVGRIEYRKNQALLAMAMRDLDIPLVLIGDVGDAGYLDHVKFLGGTNLRYYSRIEDKALLSSAYAGASAFVLPSWSEGAPLAALEAGLTGVPLILSDRSSEQEYFGEHADYISPADPEAMKAALLRVLQRHDSHEVRSARARALMSRYSEAKHVNDTLDMYRAIIMARQTVAERALVIDVSSLLHSLRVGGHMTGVPLAERMLVAEIMKAQPSARCIVYQGVKGRFIEVSYQDLENFDSDAFNRKYWFADEPDMGVDNRLVLNMAHAPAPPRIIGGKKETDSQGQARYWRARVVSLMVWLRVPRPVISKCGEVVRQLRSRKGDPKTTKVGSANVDYADVTKHLATIRVPRPSLCLTSGSRILTLGQGWISNEPLLDCLLNLASGHSLEAYVYDISYVSGAHFSGWEDNQIRQRRLNKLLERCSVVFTESRITATELAKYASSRSMSFQIVRTGLRGKEASRPHQESVRPSAAPFVLYVSSFNRRKNHDFIVQVWKDLMGTRSPISERGVKLLLVGKVQGESKYGDSVYQEELRRYNIEVVNDACDEQISQYYAHCAFTVFPSLQEGWGLPIQESLMSGKVCLTSDTVPAADEIDNAALVKLSPNDFFGWREAITTWLTNDVMREAFEAEAACYVPPSWEKIARTILGGEVRAPILQNRGTHQ